MLRQKVALVCSQKRVRIKCDYSWQIMADHLNILERDAEINGDGDVLTPPEVGYAQIPVEYAINHVVIAIAMMQLMQVHNNNEVLRLNVIDDVNGENSQLDPELANPTSELLPGNVIEDENGHNSQPDGDHSNRSYGIYKLLNIYAVSQAGILATVSSARRRREWSLLLLSGLVSIAIIVVIVLKFSQQFRQLRKEEYNAWIAQKAAIVVMLVAVSLCILLSFT